MKAKILEKPQKQGKSKKIHNYIERVNLKLKRKYGESELIKTPNKQLASKDMKIKKLQLKLQHLNHILKLAQKLKEISKPVKIEAQKNLSFTK